MVVLISLLLMIGVLFLLNANPIFTLPTWAMVVFFVGDTSVTQTLPVLAIAVIAATLGRYVLAIYSNSVIETILPKRQRKGMGVAKEILDGNDSNTRSFLISFVYSVLPLPSNALFMVAGAARVRLTALITGFMVGEYISDIFYLSVVGAVISTGQGFTFNLIAGILGLLVTIAFFMIDWEKIMKRVTKTRTK